MSNQSLNSESWELEIDGWFGNGVEGDLTRGRFSIKEIKSFIRQLLDKQREGIVKEIEDNDIKRIEEHEINGWLVGYNDCTSDILSLPSLKDNILRTTEDTVDK